jgi:hypothetical protein
MYWSKQDSTCYRFSMFWEVYTRIYAEYISKQMFVNEWPSDYKLAVPNPIPLEINFDPDLLYRVYHLTRNPTTVTFYGTKN